VRQFAIVAVGGVVGVLAAAGLVYARGAAGSQISACIDQSTGDLFITSKCPGTTLTWNIQGPQGAMGPAGLAGPPGPPGPAGHLDSSVVATIEQNLSQTASSLQALNAGIAASAIQTRKARSRFLSLESRFASAPTTAQRLNDLAEMSDQTSAELQRAMDRHSKFLTTLSNLEKKISDTAQAITQNLK